ncbi:hypothetical protein [Plebeiibacterium marinum]|uniref:Uncharacterized protein n=1 Tax=Plebeiibacterium marinum TaxID=2992111 RepID=A0AAE3SL36_9BACT|nr:hypothetical protein [Plebeiobacterium marinum]MCW3807188.1 hypothetical protein [Plebeiobacterium marinum]
MFQIGSWFFRLGNLCCRLQGTFPGWGNLAADCRGLSLVGETLLQIAGDFPQLGKPCCKLQETFPGWGNLTASCSNAYISELRIFVKYCIYNKTDSEYIK